MNRCICGHKGFRTNRLCAVHGERPDAAPPPSDAAPVAWLAEDHRFTPVKRSLHFEESTARAHHGTHEADSDEPIPLYAHPEDAPGGEGT